MLLLKDTVLFSILLRVSNHIVDFLLAETALVVSNSDGLSLTGTSLLSSDTKYGVFIDLESDFDLRDATGSRWETSKLKLTKSMVILD